MQTKHLSSSIRLNKTKKSTSSAQHACTSSAFPFLLFLFFFFQGHASLPRDLREEVDCSRISSAKSENKGCAKRGKWESGRPTKWGERDAPWDVTGVAWHGSNGAHKYSALPWQDWRNYVKHTKNTLSSSNTQGPTKRCGVDPEHYFLANKQKKCFHARLQWQNSSLDLLRDLLNAVSIAPAAQKIFVLKRLFFTTCTV